MPGGTKWQYTVVVTLTAQVKPETDDKHIHSKQSHVVPFGLAGPGNSAPALPMAPALTQHNVTAAQTSAALLTLSPMAYEEINTQILLMAIFVM